MPTLFPGATWRPMPGQEKRPRRRKGRGVGFHVAVYRGASIYDINLRTGNDAHLYVRLDGSCEQNVDLDLQAWAGADGNPSMIWVETAGGTDTATVNTELWTPPQAVTLARIARWAHDTEGTPLQVMPDSRPASRGIGTHRLGIQHSCGVGAVPGWLVSGGERWSSSVGKECPGDGKVAQIPQLIELARTGQMEDDLNADQDAMLRFLYNRISGRDVQRWMKQNPDGSPIITDANDPQGWPARSVDIADILTLTSVASGGDAAVLAHVDAGSVADADRDAKTAASIAALGTDPAKIVEALRAGLGDDFAKRVVAELGKQLAA